MVVELGHFALVLALVVALLQTGLAFLSRPLGDARLTAAVAPAAQVQFALVLCAFCALTHAYLTSDFSVANVYQNSHTAKPTIYKFAGVWGNHEGSLLLWVLILTLFGAGIATFGGNLHWRLKTDVLGVQATVAIAFLLFMIFTSNPFERLSPVPFEGRGLNPILQDPALAIHPPMLYAGYVGFSLTFAFAVAALIDGRVDAAWARWVRPWTLVAWMLLTLGIALGSWWAYYELGWGGWWFWDPVENASFMPWLLGTALLHSAVVMEKRGALKIWTILLAILTFSFSLLGTFLVRSGVLTSVHAFAVDPERGVFILAIMAFFIGGALTLFAWRAPLLKPGGLFQPISREGALVLNNLLLSVSCSAVLIGTLYPLVLEALTGAKISVGAPYFNLTFGVLMVPLLLVMPFGPMLAWKRGDLPGVSQRLFLAAGLALAGALLLGALSERAAWYAILGAGLAIWIICGALSEWAFRVKLFQAPWAETLRRARGLPPAAYGTCLAHLGVGVMVLGIIGTTAFKQEQIVAMAPGETSAIAGYEVLFKQVAPRIGPNYRETIGEFSVRSGGVVVAELLPSKRNYIAPRQATTEAGIHATVAGDLFVALGDALEDGRQTVRIYFHPLVRFIWLGALIMFFGGLVSLSDRRLRIGAPRRPRQPGVAQPAE